jgi:hypothetical protein
MEPIMPLPAWPTWMRCSQAAAEDSKLPSDFSIVRIAQLMTGEAAVGLHDVQPLLLALHLGRHAIAAGLGTGAGEFAFGWNPQHRVPIDRGIILRRRLPVGCSDGFQGELLSWRGLDLRRIHQAVTAHPDAVGGLGQIRDQEPALVVGYDDLGVFCGKAGGFRDDPDAGFGALGARDRTADIAGLDRNSLILGAEGRQATAKPGCGHADGSGKTDQGACENKAFPHRCTF